MKHSYQFVTEWRFDVPAERAFALISKPQDFPRWWGSVYLKAEVIDPGDHTGAGRLVRFRTKGFLPYTLNWDSRTTEVVRPVRIAIRATGDFEGEGTWLFEDQGAFTNITFDWNIDAEKLLIRRLTWLLRPLFAANHRWAMEQGRLGLLRQLRAPQDV